MSKLQATNDETVRLLKEGSRSYQDAMVAIMAFRHEVYTRCKAVVMRQLPALADAIGIAVSKEDVSPYQQNESPDDPGEVYLTVQVVNAEMKKARIGFYLGLAWWEENLGNRCFGVNAGFWVPRKAQDKLKLALSHSNLVTGKTCLWEDGGIYLACQLAPDEAASFESPLDELVGMWVSAGKKCGGFVKLLIECP